MNKKTILQFFLLLVIFIIFFSISITYFPNKKGEKIIEKNNIENNEKIISEENSNLIKNLSYFAEDKSGNNYTILSQFGEINEKKNCPSSFNVFFYFSNFYIILFKIF